MTMSLVAGCGPDQGSAGSAEELRLGYFANLTHAVPLIGVADGEFQRKLGAVKLSTQVFSAGPAVVEALASGGLDAAYVGPNPAINAFIRSKGEAIRVVAGSAIGGAAFIVRPEINETNLKGRTFGSPALGNTQDVALRTWLAGQGLSAPKAGGGDVNVQPAAPSTLLQLFKDGKIDGAWVPEPWASRLVLEGGGKELVDEATLWPGGRFVTAQLMVSKAYLDAHPEVIAALLDGHVSTIAMILKDPTKASLAANEALKTLSGKELKPDVLSRAWANFSVSADPVPASLQKDLDNAVALRLAQAGDLNGIYDLRLLNKALSAAGQAPVSAGGLGVE